MLPIKVASIATNALPPRKNAKGLRLVSMSHSLQDKGALRQCQHDSNVVRWFCFVAQKARQSVAGDLFEKAEEYLASPLRVLFKKADKYRIKPSV